MYETLKNPCEICSDITRNIIYDHYHGDDIDICINCYQHKYGVEDLVKNYGYQIAWGQI